MLEIVRINKMAPPCNLSPAETWHCRKGHHSVAAKVPNLEEPGNLGHCNKKLLGTSASLLVTSALLVVTRSY